MPDRVHIITLVTGEYGDTSRTVIGAYLDFNAASARVATVAAVLKFYEMDFDSVRHRLQNGGDAYIDNVAERIAAELGLPDVYISYNGLGVCLNSYYLNG